MTGKPLNAKFTQAVFDYAKALTDDSLIAVAVLTGNQAEDWLAVAVAKTPEQTDGEVIGLLMHSLVGVLRGEEPDSPV